MTLDENLKRVGPIIIGLWRFRNSEWKTPQWCSTWRYRGNYYDTFPKPTAKEALDDMYMAWTKKKRKTK